MSLLYFEFYVIFYQSLIIITATTVFTTDMRLAWMSLDQFQPTCCSAEACPLCILSEKLRNSQNGSLSFATYLCCGNELAKFVTNNLIGFPRTVDFLSIYPAGGRYERGIVPNMLVNRSSPVLVPQSYLITGAQQSAIGTMPLCSVPILVQQWTVQLAQYNWYASKAKHTSFKG